jgi:hypothetical protein
MINDPEAEYSEAVVERPQLTTSALKKDLKTDNSISLRMSISTSWVGMRSKQS